MFKVPQPSTPLANIFGGDSEAGLDAGDLQFDLEGEQTSHVSSQPVRIDHPMPRGDFNRALFEARMDALGDSELKLPWEQGIWKTIFSDDDSDVFRKLFHLCQANI